MEFTLITQAASVASYATVGGLGAVASVKLAPGVGIWAYNKVIGFFGSESCALCGRPAEIGDLCYRCEDSAVDDYLGR